MKKHFLSFLLFIFCQAILADTGYTLTYSYSVDNTCLIHSITITGEDVDVVIPTEANINNKIYTVQGFETKVFSNTNIRSIEIPYIENFRFGTGDYEFNGCTKLERVVIKAPIKEIGKGTFQGCSSLVSIELPNTITVIRDDAFKGCKSLESISLPESLSGIGCPFSGCLKLTSIIFPASLQTLNKDFLSETSIKDATFKGPIDYNVLEAFRYHPKAVGSSNMYEGTIRLQGKLTKSSSSANPSYAIYCNNLFIDNDAFVPTRENEKKFLIHAKSITYGPNSTKDILSTYCTDLTSINVDDENPIYSSSEGMLCSKSGKTLLLSPSHIYKKIIIPNNVDSIANSAFKDCVYPEGLFLSNVIHVEEDAIPWSFNEIIGNFMFYRSNCEDGMHFTIPEGIQIIAKNAFGKDLQYYNNTIDLPSSLRVIEDEGLAALGLNSITLPSNLEYIGHHAFRYSKLSSLTIPANTSYVGGGLCNSLKVISVSNDSPYLSSSAGVLYDKEMTTLLYCPCMKTGDFIIPESVTKIGDYAFEKSNLSSISFNKTLKTIGTGAFYYSNIGDNVVLPDSLNQIGSYSFYRCYKLKSIQLGDGLEKIGENAFNGCSNMTKASIGHNLEELPSSAFAFCSNLKEIELGVKLVNMQSNSFTYCNNLENIYLYNPKASSLYDPKECMPKGTIHVLKDATSYTTNSLWKELGDRLVLDLDPISVKKIQFVLNSNIVCQNTEFKMSVNISPSAASNKKLTWESSNENIIVNLGNGAFYALEPGKAVITAKSTDGSNISTSIELEVLSEKEFENYTGIDNLDYNNSQLHTNRIFSIDGKNFNTNLSKQGIYIVNGKKYVINRQ